MALNKIKLGELIEESNNYNEQKLFGIEHVRGISNNKQIIKSKANVDSNVIHKFYIVYPGEFVYNPRTTRMGKKVGFGFNNTEIPLLFSFNNIAFRIKEDAKQIVSPFYLYIYFNRNEFDRYAIINSWGSATEILTFDEMCDIEIELPDLATQEKFVNVYLSMVENQKSYEKGLNDLKLLCNVYIENLRKQVPCEEIGKYIKCTDKKTDDITLNIRGISNQQKLIDSNSRTQGVNKEKYLKIEHGEFGYSPIHINDGSIAFNNSNISYLLSPIYKTFKVINNDLLHPEYLMMWFSRKEFIRYCRYYAFGSARDTFEWNQMCEVKIPIPSIDVQKSIASLYNCYVERKLINEKLKQQIKDICPILIKGSIMEAKWGNNGYAKIK